MTRIRVVSLVPSATETLFAWGIPPVAVTRWCEHPELSQVGGTKDPDVEAIVALGPDIVVMDREENRRDDAVALAAAGVDVHSLWIRSVADVGPQLAELARRVGCVDRWNVPAPRLLEPAPGPLVFVPIWRVAPRAGRAAQFTTLSDDTYGASVLAAAGGRNAYGPDVDRYPVTTLAEAAQRRPDLVLAPSEPYKFTRRHIPELGQLGPVVLVDGRDLFWWGSRTEGALERVQRLLRGG